MSDSMQNDNMAGFEVAVPPNGMQDESQEFVPASSSDGVEDPDMKEVMYTEGATPLYLAVEETNWLKALEILENDPSDASTWVVSTGTVGTTFDWSLWRRLPLHEACRRQAPAWFVSNLLSAFPPAASLRTQFGELPIHLAVENGATPEVTNLLLVWHWRAIAETDQSGRTPLDLLKDSELLDQQEYKTILEALQQSTNAYEQMQQEREAEIKVIHVKHAAGLVAVQQQHDDDLAVEQEQQERLVKEVDRLKNLVNKLKGNVQQQKGQLELYERRETKIMNQVETLNRRVLDLQEEKKKESAVVVALEQLLERKNADIAELKDTVLDLQTALQRLTLFHQTDLRSKIDETHRDVRRMLSTYVGLRETLLEHESDLRSLLEASGIEELPLPEPEVKVEEKKEDDMHEFLRDMEDDIMNEEAMISAAMAASSALGHC